MRVAVWTPLPPQRSGIADYSFDLLGELTSSMETQAVVLDSVADDVVAPAGVEVVAASVYSPDGVDLDIYQIGNHAGYHEYVHAAALHRPGVLVLHDPAVVDLIGRICRGFGGSIFMEEVRLNVGEIEELPMIETTSGPEIDRVRLLLSKRLVDASLATVVHSAWARGALLSGARRQMSR